MDSLLEEKSFLTQKVKIKKKYSNKEIQLHHFFHQKTKIFPENVIIHNQFIFFFVKSEDYFKAKRLLKNLRTQLIDKKILIIRSETTLIKLLFSFFPDTYIHDITLSIVENTGKRLVKIIFLFYEDRGIAVGRSGDYINLVNKIFENYITLEKFNTSIEIKCEIIELEY
ncbi:MAG: hypothetical protein EU529_04790 [Promethearchaeota archaeon]|nr:MAG: hypothetical protein EU529_04790 [Candidatus Lokiarchaeota archaeon]